MSADLEKPLPKREIIVGCVRRLLSETESMLSILSLILM